MKTENSEQMNVPQAFYFSLANLEIPKQLLGKTSEVLKLRMSRRYKAVTMTSSMASFLILAIAFGRVLGVL